MNGPAEAGIASGVAYDQKTEHRSNQLILAMEQTLMAETAIAAEVTPKRGAKRGAPKQGERRRQALYDFKHKAIVDAARRVLAAKGAEGLTMRAVAAEAGYAPGAVYFYFRGKAELLADIHVQDLGNLARGLRELKRATATETLTARLQALYDRMGSDDGALEAALYFLSDGEVGSEVDRAVTGRIIALLTALHEPIAKSGVDAASRNALTLGFAATAIGLGILQRSQRMKALGLDGHDVLAVLATHVMDGTNALPEMVQQHLAGTNPPLSQQQSRKA